MRLGSVGGTRIDISWVGSAANVIQFTCKVCAVGQTHVIASNTNSSILLCAKWTTTPSAKFVINDYATEDGAHPSNRTRIRWLQ